MSSASAVQSGGSKIYADCAATDVLIRESDSHCVTKKQLKNLSIGLPNGNTITSTTAGLLSFPGAVGNTLTPTQHNIPAHILADKDLSTSLLAIAPLCDNGLTVVLTNTSIQVTDVPVQVPYVVYHGFKKPEDRLWALPLESQKSSLHGSANIVVKHDNLSDAVAWVHASFGSPPTSSFLNMLSRMFVRIPGISAKIARANMPNSMATAMGHLKRTRMGQHSTKPVEIKSQLTAISQDVEEPDDPNNLYIQILDPASCHIDNTGRFPVTSVSGNNYILIAVCDGYIRAVPMPSRKATDIVKAVKSVFVFFTSHGRSPLLQRLDNETSNHLFDFYRTNDITWQLVPPYCHRGNKAEKAIGTYKEHFISILCTTSPGFPGNRWDGLMPLAEITINLLRPCTHNKYISAYEGMLKKKYDMVAHPFGIAGCRVAVHESRGQRASWAPLSTPGYYMGPADATVRCHNVLVTKTNSLRVSDSVAWFPTPLRMPGSSVLERLNSAIDNLGTSIKDLSANSAYSVQFPQLQDITQDAFDSLSVLSSLFLPHSSTTQPEQSTDLPALPEVAAVPEVPLEPPPPVQRVSPGTAVGSDETTMVTGSPRVPPPPVQRVPAEAAVGSGETQSPTVVQSISPEPVGMAIIPEPLPFRPPKHQRPRKTAITPKATASQRPSKILQQKQYHNQRPQQLPSLPEMDRPNQPFRPQKWPTDRVTRRGAKASSVANAQRVSTSALPTPIEQKAVAYSTLNLDAHGKPLTYTSALAGPNQSDWSQKNDEEIIRLLLSDTLDPILHDNIPRDRLKDIAYYNPQVKEKMKDGEVIRRVRGTVGGNVIDYPGDVSAPTAEMAVVKLLVQSTISKDAEWMTADISDYYLNTPLERPEYIRVPLKYFSTAVMERFKLTPFIRNNAIECQINKGMYGLKQAGLLAQQQLIPHLALHGYDQCKNTPCLFKHRSNGVIFTLVVDDFGIQYTDKAGAEHLMATLRLLYRITVDWTGRKYLGSTIIFNRPLHQVSMTMPGYVSKALKRFNHGGKHAHSPSIHTPPQYGVKVQVPTIDDSPPLDAAGTKFIQEVVGVFLFYARAIDSTMLPAVTALSSEQTKPTAKVMASALRLLDYAAAYPDNALVFHACDMILFNQSDATFLSLSGARSKAGGIFYCGNRDQFDVVNGAIHALSIIIDVVTGSVAESEYGSMFINGQIGHWLRVILEDLGYPQPPTLILCDNETAVKIANNSCKAKKSKSMDMRFHWIRDRVKQGQFIVRWRAGAHNLADFFTKPLPVSEHLRLMPLLVHTPHPPSSTYKARQHQRAQAYRKSKA